MVSTKGEAKRTDEDQNTCYVVGPPIIQSLGFAGDAFRLKVSFPVFAERGDNPEGDPRISSSRVQVGARAIILEMRAEDLPMMDNPLHFPLSYAAGIAIREAFGVDEDERWG